MAATAVATAVLLMVLGVAVIRPGGMSEAVFAILALLGASLLVALGVVPWASAWGELAELAPTVGFLAAVLVLAHLADAEGVFTAAGAMMARGSGGRPVALLGLVFGVASVVTAVLSLDATVVLLTPVVFGTATSLRLRVRPHVYACAHLANSASLLLPVSNLTNLLAFRAAGVSFVRFGSLMALPWLAVLAVEYLVFRRFFATDLHTPASGQTARTQADVPIFALGVVGLTLAGFTVASVVGVNPAWAAAGGAGILAIRRLLRGGSTPSQLITAASPTFLLFVFTLGVAVRGVQDHGLGRVIHAVVPGSTSLPGLFGTALVAAVLANLVNNLPAVLMVVPVVADSGPGAVLAVLIGVNVGSNLTYVGSLATLLWRRTLRHGDAEPALSEFVRLGAVTVPAGLAAGVLALWIGLRLWGA